MKNIFWYVVAAFGEIGGCYAFWMWRRLGKSAWHLGWGVLALLVFALALTRVEAAQAGRIYAAYSAIYLVASLFWMRAVEGVSPDRWDAVGACICLAGAGVIIFAPR